MKIKKMTKKIFFIGLDNDMLDLCLYLGQEVIGYSSLKNEDHLSLSYYGNDTDFLAKIKDLKFDFNLILTIDPPKLKQKLIDLYSDYKFERLISPLTHLSPLTQLPNHIIVQHNVLISSYVAFGEFVKINIGAQIHHDCKIGNYVTIAPKATILGKVTIDDYTYIGANSVIRQNIKIGKNCIIGAGAVVVKDVSDNMVMVGNPARPINGK